MMQVRAKIQETREWIMDQLHPEVPEPWEHVEIDKDEPLALFKVCGLPLMRDAATM